MYRVSDLKKAEAFYRDVLGLKKVWEDKEQQMIGFVFEKSDSEIVIHANSDLPKFEYWYLVDNVVNFCKHIQKLGHRVVTEPKNTRPGKYAIISDLDGNEIPIIDLTKFDGQPHYD
ncbi:VOC family protein [Candidatus Gottesmanbacteria bacterium]|nr:VOC family protein [Candidatus Gottesmanbacteria bacterium]